MSVNIDSISINMNGLIYNQTVILNGKQLLNNMATQSTQEQ